MQRRGDRTVKTKKGKEVLKKTKNKFKINNAQNFSMLCRKTKQSNFDEYTYICGGGISGCM